MVRQLRVSANQSRLVRPSGDRRRQRVGWWPNSPFASGSLFTPAQLSSLVQRFLDANPTYHNTLLQSLPILTPEEPGTVAVPRGQRCALFDGVNDYAALGARLTTGVVSVFTLVAMVKFTGSGTYIIASESGTQTSWALFAVAGTIRITGYSTVSGNDSFSLITTATVNDGAWHHVAVKLSGGVLSIYIDGAVAAGTNSTIGSGGTTFANADSTARFMVGRRNEAAALYFPGSLRDVRVYNVAKTAGEIAAIYNQASTPSTIDTTGLLGMWPLQEESGTTAYDCSGNGKHLTLTNITQGTFHATDSGVTYNVNNWKGHTVANNLLTRSQEFNNAAWTKSSGATITTDAGVAPDGTVTADRLTYSSGDPNLNRIAQIPSASGQHVVSLYVKKGTQGSKITLYQDGSPFGGVYDFDLNSPSGTYQDVGNGWYRIWFSRTWSNQAVSIGSYTGGVGTGGDNFLIWGAQLEPGVTPTPYAATTGSTFSGVVIPASLSTPSQDAAGNALGVAGPVAHPVTTEVNCFTGDGAAANVDCSIPFIPATADVSISFWLYPVAGGVYDRVISQSGGTSGGFEIVMDSSSANLAFFLDHNATTLSSVATTTASAWNYVTVTRVGNVWTLTVTNPSTGATSVASTTLSYSVTQAVNFRVGKYGPGAAYTASRICGLAITTGGVTKRPLFDQCGPGSSNTNRDFYILGSDGSAILVSGGIVSGTIANIYANRCPYVKDWAIQYGGSFNPNLLSYTNTFTNAAWTKVTATLTANDLAGPDGVVSATKIVFANSTSEVSQQISASAASRSISIYVKGTTGETIRVGDGSGTATVFTLTGNWDRLTVVTSASNPYLSINTYSGSTARTVWVRDAQLELGSVATPYQANATTPNGAFIPGRIGSANDAAGNAKTLSAGKHGNPYSRLVPNYWSAPELVNIGYTSSSKLAPSTTVQSTSPADTKFARIKAAGSDRYFATLAALTGTNKTNAEGYVG